MRVTLFMAVSVNGMIATEGGGEDFLSDENWKTFASLVEEFGNFIVGSRTYEAVSKWGENYSLDDFPNAKKIVVSDSQKYKLKDGYQLAGSPKHALDLLTDAGFGKGLLAGGSNLNASFASEHLINEIILNIEPVLIGRGIPLLKSTDFQLQLDLIESTKIAGGIAQLHYRVMK